MLEELTKGDWIETGNRIYEIASNEGEFLYAREVEYMSEFPKLRYGKPTRLNKCELARNGYEITEKEISND